jgi:hypothetical protein
MAATAETAGPVVKVVAGAVQVGTGDNMEKAGFRPTASFRRAME